MARKPVFGWFGPVSGILFVILLIVAFVSGSVDVNPEDSAATIAAELEEKRDGRSDFFGLFFARVLLLPVLPSPTCATGSGASGRRELGSSRCSGAPGCCSLRWRS